MSKDNELETNEAPVRREDLSLKDPSHEVRSKAAVYEGEELETQDEIETRPEGKTAQPEQTEQPAKKAATKKAAPKK